MANVGDKTQANAFYQARLKASKTNEALSSRAGAAEILSMDPGKLYRIETGIGTPYPEEVLLMADLYGAPELTNHFCRKCCPLGNSVPEIDTNELDRISVRAISLFRKISKTENTLLDIAEDGKVTEDEKEDMLEVLKTLGDLEAVTQNLKNWVKKNLEL